MQNTNAPRFIFSAYANSVGAVIQQPAKAFLADAPSAAIQVTGGLSSHSKENVSLSIESHQVLRAGRVSATVHGEQRGNNFVTLATATVEKLNILDVITADAVVSKVTSVFPADGNRAERLKSEFHGARFYLAGSYFDNLKIAGKMIEFKTKGPYDARDGFLIKKADIKHESLIADECRQANILNIPEFGIIHLGQIDIYSEKVILTMVRVELGCPFTGKADVACASTNGVDD